MYPKRLSTTHRLMIRDAVFGLSNSEIATRYKYESTTVSSILNSALAQAEIAELSTRVKELVAEQIASDPVTQYAHTKGMDAVKEMVDNMYGESPTAQRAREHVLALGGRIIKQHVDTDLTLRPAMSHDSMVLLAELMGGRGNGNGKKTQGAIGATAEVSEITDTA